MATEILPRLPVKSLARFRCVCKQWRSLTYDPRFAMEQLIRGADADPASTGLCKLNRSCNFVPIKEKTPMYSLNGLDGGVSGLGIDGDRKIIDLSYHFKFRSGGRYMLSNSVNGLACALCHDDSANGVFYPYLFNPTTREVLPLPELSGCAKGGIGTLSLGFDSSSGQYMVVCSDFSYTTTFRVLTVGSREWRCLLEINCVVHPVMVVLLDGALHWQANDYESGSSAILAFDIKDERFRFIPIPDTIISMSYLRDLWKLKGHLCLVLQPVASGGGHEADRLPFLRMWKLEDGANPGWIRVHINVTRGVDDKLYGYEARVTVGVGGKSMIRWGPRLYSYDEVSGTLNLVAEGLQPCWGSFDAFTPSLVSPSSLHAY